MLPKFFNTILRLAGLLITILLLVQPWLISVESVDPFLYSGWAQIIAAIISLTFSSILLAIYRPKNGYITLNAGLLVLFLAISVALYNSPYNVCFRASILAVGLIANLGSLRLLRKQQDNFSVGGMISVFGLIMAIYAICQATNYDFFFWGTKESAIVGTLANPNFLGIFMCLTSAVTFGMFAETYSKSKKHGFIFFVFYLIQISVIFILNRSGLLFCFLFMVILWIWSRWFKISGKITRRTPIIAGLILALLLLAGQWMVYKSTSSYDWNKITKISSHSQTVVSRFILWQMGFEIFLNHLKTGAGVGSVAYIMPLKRPPTGSTLGIKIYNDDPHSFLVTALAETGFLGLLGICILLASIYGCYIRKNTRYESVELTNEQEDNQTASEPKQCEPEVQNAEAETKNTEATTEEKNNSSESITNNKHIPDFPWLYTLIMVIILYLAFKSGFISPHYQPITVCIFGIVIFFGAYTSLLNNSYISTRNDYRYLGRSTLVALFTFVFYSFFNNTFSTLPLIGFVIMLVSLHYSCCQPDVQWKPRMTFVSFLFLALPVIYGIAAYNVQINYQKEQNYIHTAKKAYENCSWAEAEDYFRKTIKQNSQQLEAYYGLAKSLYAQQKFEEAQETLLQLDSMVPNIYNAKLEIANILFQNNKILEAHRFAVQNLEWAENPLSYEMLGKILLVEGRISEAEKVFNEGLISIPTDYQERLAADRIRLSLAALACNRGDFKTCKTHLQSIKTEVSENLDALYMKGMLLTNAQQYDKALEIFEKALNAYPHLPRLLNAVGYNLVMADKDLDRAQVLLEEAYQIVRSSEQPNLSDLLDIANSLGKLYFKQNKLKQAGELLKLSYEGTPDEWKAVKEKRLQDLNNFYNSFSEAE